MLIRNATLASGHQRDVRVTRERITAVESELEATDGERIIDATGKRLLPGMIDVHVHVREPGFEHKETWKSATKSAAAGGVTTVVDQPNTDPPTLDGAGFDRKLECAKTGGVDFGINGGVTEAWDPDSLFERPLFALGEIFLADSTGEMSISEELFVDALTRARDRGVPVTVHAEDDALFDPTAKERDDADAWSAYRRADAEIEAVRRACLLARERDTRIHVAHATTPESIDIAARSGSTCEVTPHHMFLSRADLSELGTHGRMNPPLRRERHRSRVFKRVVDGTVDVVASDHAPHTLAEKDVGIWDAPSGVPGVETSLPLLLNEARTGTIGYDRVRDLTSRNPSAIFNLERKGSVSEGMDADLVLVDPDAVEQIHAEKLHTNCEWTPFDGFEAVFPEWTMCRGTVVYRRDSDSFERIEPKNVRD